MEKTTAKNILSALIANERLLPLIEGQRWTELGYTLMTLPVTTFDTSDAFVAMSEAGITFNDEVLIMDDSLASRMDTVKAGSYDLFGENISVKAANKTADEIIDMMDYENMGISYKFRGAEIEEWCRRQNGRYYGDPLKVRPIRKSDQAFLLVGTLLDDPEIRVYI